MKLNGIKETCLYTTNLEEAKDFYSGLLGLDIITYMPNRHLFLRVGYSVLLIFNPKDSSHKISPPPHYGEGPIHIAFEVDSIEYLAWKDKIRALNIPIIDELIWKSGKESFYFKDPANHILEIVPEGIWDNNT